MNNEIYFFLIYPAIIAILTTVISYVGTSKIKKNELEKTRINLMNDFLKKLHLGLESLSSLLSTLADGPSKLNYFPLQTTSQIKQVLIRAQSQISDSLYLVDGKGLTDDILEVIDSTSTIVEEIESMENNPIRAREEHKKTIEDAKLEFKSLELKLFEMGIYLDSSDQPINIETTGTDEERNDQKIIRARVFINNLIDTLKQSKSNLDEFDKRTNEHRAFLAVKLISTQTKVKELTSSIKSII